MRARAPLRIPESRWPRSATPASTPTWAEPFSFERWLDALKAGHTFVTTGPALLLTVNGHLPGDTVDVAPGTKLDITAEAYGQPEQVPLRSLEIVGHSKGAPDGAAGMNSAHLSVKLELPVDHGIWIAAKCEAGKAQVAHTTPVYVTVNGGGFQNPDTARHYLELSEQYLRSWSRN